MNWQDYKYLLEVSRARNLQGAADKLDVSISTVFRRLEKIESDSGGSLFDRTTSGYVPNAIGEELINVAERVEQEISAVEKLVKNLDSDVSGKIKLTGTEVLIPFFINKHINTVLKKFPALEFEIIAENRNLNLSTKEADIALRPQRPTNNDLYGRKVSNIYWGIYGSSALENPPEFNNFRSIKQFDFIGLTGSKVAQIAMLEQESRIQGVNVSNLTNNLVSMASLVASGAGLGFLPCIIGEQWPGLTCHASAMENKFGELWVVCHKNLRRNKKTMAMIDFIAEAAHKDKALFEGPASASG